MSSPQRGSQNSNDMGDCKYQTQNIRNRRRLLYANAIFVLALVLGSATRCHSQGVVGSMGSTADCSGFTGCMKCTLESMCSWSLESQSCHQSTDITGNLIVHIEGNCPEYTVTTNVSWDAVSASEAYTFQVKVSNDLHGFLTFLQRSRLTCWLDGMPSHGKVVEDVVVCGTGPAWTPRQWAPKKPRVLFNYVTFDDNVLRVDDVGVNYVMLDKDCPGLGRSYCASCSWSGPDYTHFYARCAANNTCTGQMEYYERRETRNYHVAAVSEAADLRLQCPEMAIVAVSPASARWNIGTPVTITVGGHAILADGRDVTVTVAGRACTGPVTVGERTLACTVSPATEHGPIDGPVIVRYGRRAVVVSAQRFWSVYPEVHTMSPVCGPLKGGTRLRIGGRSLNISTVVRVTVGAAALECRTTDCDDRSINCVTAPSAVASSGPVMVLFDKSLSEHVASSTFAYTDAVPTVDKGQRYRIYRALVAGRGTVSVHGRHLSCVEKAEIFYVYRQAKRYASCAVEGDTRMVCNAPGPGQWPAPDPDHFGFLVTAANSVLDISPQPDPSGYFWFATSTTVKVVISFALFGCLAYCYVRNKKRSADAARNLVVEFKGPVAEPAPKYNNLI